MLGPARADGGIDPDRVDPDAPEGREELFDLDADPDELHECSADPEYAETLVLWRQRMVDHLSERGEQWVKDGKLVRRPEPMLYGLNYPGDSTEG